MSVPTINPLAAALQARLALDPEVVLAGLDPVPLPSDKARSETARSDQAQKPATAASAVETARQAAAIRQSGVAPLMADLEQALESRALPAPVREAAAKVVALQTPVAEPVTPETIKRAVARSGLFLEPRLAQERAPAPDLKSALLLLRQVLRAAAPPPPAAPLPQGAPSHLTAAPLAAPQSQAGLHGRPAPAAPQAAGLAQTYAPQGARLPSIDIPDLPAAPAPAASAPVASAPKAAAVAAPSTALPPTSPTQIPSSATPPQASAVLHVSTPPATTPQASAHQAPAQIPSPAGATSQAAEPQNPHTPATQPQTPALQTGPKSAPLPPGPATVPPTADLPVQPLAPGQRPVSALPPQMAPLPLPGLPEEAGAAPESKPTAQTRAERPTAAAHQEAPAPPVKGAPPQGQQAAQPQLSADADPVSMIRHLERATSGAIARTELFQLASLPDAPRADGEQAARQSSWLFEVPLATPQGPAVAQFEIERDGSGDEVGRETQAWRTRFSVDLEPLGLIHALLVLSGGKTSVTLWAEREETLARLRRDQAELAGSLEAEVAVYPGQPRAPAASPGRFLDASS